MSLINDLLKDLERRPHSMSSENLLAGLRVEISSEYIRNKKYYQVIGVLCVALVLSCALVIWKQHSIKLAHAQFTQAKILPAPAVIIKPTAFVPPVNPPVTAPIAMASVNKQKEKIVPAPIDLLSKEEEVSPVPAIKKAVQETLAEQKFQFALRLSNAGQSGDAIEVLKQLLLDFPLHSEARRSLAAFLIQDGDNASAEQVLNEGLALQKDFPPFMQLKARLLANEGKLTEALAILEKNQPSISDEPEYYVLLAALYQRAGKSVQAVNLYKQLLALEPANAKWWLGLGISLEASGNRNQAAEAYANADNIGDLSPELKAYVDTKMTMLG